MWLIFISRKRWMTEWKYREKSVTVSEYSVHSASSERTRRTNSHIFQPIIDITGISGVTSASLPTTLTMTRNCDYGGRGTGTRVVSRVRHSGVKLIHPGMLIARLFYAVACATQFRFVLLLHRFCTHAHISRIPNFIINPNTVWHIKWYP